MKDLALKRFENTCVTTTEDGKCDLGDVIGSKDRENYVRQQVNTWLDEWNALCNIARIEPQTAYSCFVSGCKHKVTYTMRSNPDISHQLDKIDRHSSN